MSSFKAHLLKNTLKTAFFDHFGPIFGPGAGKTFLSILSLCSQIPIWELLKTRFWPFFIIFDLLTTIFAAVEALWSLLYWNLIVYRPSESNQNHIRNRYHNLQTQCNSRNLYAARRVFQKRKSQKAEKSKNDPILWKSWFLAVLQFTLGRNMSLFRQNWLPKGVKRVKN